jgi:RNA polymerase sigma-70 factor (ECF subfamily)
MTVPAQHLDGDPYPPEGDFESFFERWYPSVVSYARRFGAAHAEEIAQETLFRAFSCFADLRRDAPMPWLRKVAHNIACDMHRAGRRMGPMPEAGEADPVDLAEGPEESLLRLERVGHMRAALRDISAADRQLLHMLVVDEASVEEAANRLDVTANVVRVRLHRARRRLGSHYLRRAGHQALGIPLLVATALRRILRPSTRTATRTATRSAPALAAVAALGGLTAATLVLSQPSAPQHAWTSARASEQTFHHPRAVAVRRQPLAHTKVARPALTRASRAAGSSAVGDGLPDTGIKTHLKISDPHKQGKVADGSITIPTPIVPIRISTSWTRSGGEGLLCMVAHQDC